MIGRLVASMAVCLVALVGCSGENKVKELNVDTRATTPSATPLSNNDGLKFFKNLWSGDPERMEAALAMTDPGSIAAAYVSFQLHSTNAAIDFGQPYSGNRVTEAEDGFKSCTKNPDQLSGEDQDTCASFGNVESTDGKIASFTVDGGGFDDRLSVGNGSKVDAGDLAAVEYLSSLEAKSGEILHVNLRLTAKKGDVSTDFLNAKYRAPVGRQTKAQDAFSPDQLSADSSTYVSLYFPRAKAGGTITFSVFSADFNTERQVKIKTR